MYIFSYRSDFFRYFYDDFLPENLKRLIFSKLSLCPDPVKNFAKKDLNPQPCVVCLHKTHIAFAFSSYYEVGTVQLLTLIVWLAQPSCAVTLEGWHLHLPPLAVELFFNYYLSLGALRAAGTALEG